MIKLADVLSQYGPAYVQKYGQAMPGAHRQVLEVLQRCRSGQLGYALYHCPACDTWQAVPRSCGNRHCPGCQQHKTQQWLDKQMKRRLPCPYFLLTFTVPQELRRAIRSNQRVGYEAMFQSSVNALRKVADDDRYLASTRLGLLAVLHTWGRTLEYHPHIHMLVPAGGLSGDACQWRATRCLFLVPVKVLSRIYRDKMRHALTAAGLDAQVDSTVWDSDWVVHCQPVGNGEHCLRYLARYVFRVAISNQRIVSCDEGRVVFLYRKAGSHRWRRMMLDAMEFLRRFLQHVLPSGFLRVRHYGFLRAQAKESPAQIGRLIEDYYSGLVQSLPLEPTTLHEPVVSCPQCGEPMELVKLSFAPPMPLCDSG